VYQVALRINEIFHSIQGESIDAGLPFVFIRLTGCNLRCRYCDTQYAYDEGQWLENDIILKQLSRFGCARVTLTGGEPLLQAQTPELVTLLLENGFHVSVETNGSMDISALDARCIKVMDVKCPSSGMHQHNRLSNLKLLGSGDQLKFVIADQADFEFACRFAGGLGKTLLPGNILFSPAHRQLAGAQLADWMLQAGTNARLQIQLHKYLWPDIERGV
jgi:7-carboxy-7-deazaguanine synthase